VLVPSDFVLTMSECDEGFSHWIAGPVGAGDAVALGVELADELLEGLAEDELDEDGLEDV
jgi:hypothetical protein